jgi:hypothetical protein
MWNKHKFDHGFQEDNTLEGHHVKGQNLVMASKRSSLDGRKSLWKEHMSRSTIGVRRVGSNSPTKDITMSTTGSKSLEVEGMGDDGKSTSGGKIECISPEFLHKGEEKRIDDGYHLEVARQCSTFT